ncbi:MAG TPA: methyltransferase domain-containing protein [Solirubrobacteraceae bacterium]
MTAIVDTAELRERVREMYRVVATDPGADLHFETGRALAERLGYPAEWLDAVPPAALASFAGVGHMLDLAAIEPGDTVLDLGSGSGTDAFVAAALAGPAGRVIGVDMTDAQLAKARGLAGGRPGLEFVEGLIEDPPVAPGSVDVVISNGVINLAPDKDVVFRAVAGALRPGGRLAIADIVSARELADRTRANVALWAACIAGAVPRDDYLGAIERAGLRIETVRENEYRFTSDRARAAAEKYGVTSVTVLATKPGLSSGADG